MVFKLLFGDPANRDLLVSLLSAVLRPSSPIEVVDVLNPELPKDAVVDKGIFLDLHVRLLDGRHVDVEMQSARELTFSERALFYLARMYSTNLHKGGDYADLKQCVSILILDYCPWQTDRFHCTFHVAEDRSHEFFSQAIEIHTVELPKLPPLESSSAVFEAGERALRDGLVHRREVRARPGGVDHAEPHHRQSEDRTGRSLGRSESPGTCRGSISGPGGL